MFYFCANGEMAEWSNAAVLKTVVRLRGPGVRIPLSPLTFKAIFDKRLQTRTLTLSGPFPPTQ
jgi:hypothetical protein